MAHLELIEKPAALVRGANLSDYATARASFTWEGARRELAGLPDGDGLNMAYEAVDRHAEGAQRDAVALRFVGGAAGARDVTWGALRDRTSRFANVLQSLGVARGERVATLLGRSPELYVAMLGTLKNGSVYCPLFSTFGPEPVRARLAAGRVSVLVTTEPLYRIDVEPIRRTLPDLRHVLLVPDGARGAEPPGTSALAPLLAAASAEFVIPPTSPDDPALLFFTSGTTAGLKGAILAHGAVVAHHATARSVLDLHPGRESYWCQADPGWVTGTVYGAIAPLVARVRTVIDEGDGEPERTYQVLQEEGVTVWYTTPTTLHGLMKLGAEAAWSYDLSRLRLVACVGEPLDPPSLRWAIEALGRTVHDTWWQTETGAIVMANFPAVPIKPGSMGRPIPGARVAVVRRSGAGVEVVEGPEAEGELAIDATFPALFRAYVGAEERYAAAFAGGWYLTGDLVRRDADDHYWFLGRADDVIKCGAHLIGPFEVERALVAHPAVAEAAAVGKPDPVLHEIVKVFVTLRRSYEPSEPLRREILAWARARLGEEVAPRELDFAIELPRTQSGKLLRRLLRAHEGRLPETDDRSLVLDA
jgi:acetyl-CoA synthetase